MIASTQRRRMLHLLAAGGVGTSLLGLPGRGHAQGTTWQPTQAVNYLISVAPGGSVDLYARGIKNALESLALVNGQTVLPDNKPGAAGLLALQVMQRNAGNAHYLATFHTGGIAGQVTGMLKADVRDYVPVAMLVEETTLVAVRDDSPLKTARDLVDALKRNPASVKIAVAPLPGLNTHLAIAKPLKVAGVDVSRLTVVPFRSSGDSMTALLGGHVDVVSATGPTVVPLVAAGKVRPQHYVRDTRNQAWRPVISVREVRALDDELFKNREHGNGQVDELATLSTLIGLSESTRETMLLGLHLAMKRTRSTSGLVHCFDDADKAPVTRVGEGVEDGIGRRLSDGDPLTRAARAQHIGLGDPRLDSDFRAAATRLGGDVDAVSGVAMVPLIGERGVVAMMELGRADHPFRMTDAVVLREVMKVVTSRLDVIS